MKKKEIAFLCFIALYIASEIYVSNNFKPHSGYWLAFQLSGLLVMLLVYIFTRIFQRESSKWPFWGILCLWSLYAGYFGYRDIMKYKNDACINKFGREFNKIRHSHGVPVIPTGWDESFMGTGSAEWKRKDGGIGHRQKYIRVDSACTVSYEDDDYDLKPNKGVSRSVSITTRYAKRRGKDTTSFDYEVGDSTRTISRQQADSLFAAEKIKKDY